MNPQSGLAAAARKKLSRSSASGYPKIKTVSPTTVRVIGGGYSHTSISSMTALDLEDLDLEALDLEALASFAYFSNKHF